MFWRKGGGTGNVKAIEGKDGFFFIHHDSNEVMKQITGQIKASKRKLAAIETAHQQRRAICSEMGIDYRHVICPNKESVLTDKLPEPFVYEQYGPTFLQQYLSATPNQSCFYDRNLLKTKQNAYFLTDSHWTELGAVPYLEAALEHFGDDRAVQRLRDLKPEAVPIKHQGDLGLALQKPPEMSLGLLSAAASASAVFDGGAISEGTIRLQRSPEAVNKGLRALVLHDSFTYFLYRFVSELYEETLFINTPDLDPRFLRHFSPSIVWFFQAERFMPRVPRNDIDFLALIKSSEKRKNLPVRNSAFLETQWPAAFI